MLQVVMIAACSGRAVQPVVTFVPLSAASTVTPIPPLLFISPAVPESLRDELSSWGITETDDPIRATINVDITQPSPGTARTSTWVFALVAPFPTVIDGISSQALHNFWKDPSTGPFGGSPLLMAESTLASFTFLWGEPASGAVRIVSIEQLLDVAWAEIPSWAIIPFDSVQLRWKVLNIDGQSPIEKRFDINKYPLVATYRVQRVQSTEKGIPDLPVTNRDSSKMTAAVVTGVTALVRATASTMEIKGVTYPGRDTREVFREADILHISNEVSFYNRCPYPDLKRPDTMFCSHPRYMGLLLDIGVDVVELTGNHIADFGVIPINQTLEIYKQNHILYFGGGMDLEDSLKPALLEDHGNKIAFIGCNQPDIKTRVVADKDRPGAAPCDFDYLSQKISDLHQKGYAVISTFQWNEKYNPNPDPDQITSFRLAADSGADIVSGSQAHLPQIMEFYKGSFIHYGLGNLFFDQMDVPTEGTRREFADRYVIYEGRAISVQLLTLWLEDYSRPRFMTDAEREKFLLDYFTRSGWDFPQAGH